ncbi:MAG TPA: SDR family oxidoreductase [Anaerolineales bacterium]|nr:SDR family oxidoreductase [Anaerolineales bacterium]
MEIKDKIAVVTGGAHRVGKAIASGLAEAGAHLVVHYHQSEDQAKFTVGEIKQRGVQAIAVGGDLTSYDAVVNLFRAAEAEFGGVDILVNSAAIMESGNVLTLTPEAWQRTLGINLTGPFFCAQQAALLMKARKGGVIVNIADVSAFQPWAKYPAHSVSKAGLVMLTKVLAKALAPEVRVNAIAPGPVIKPDDWPDERWRTVGRHTLLKRTGSGYDVARAVNFIVEQDFMTGETLVIDGGSLYV